MKKLFITAAILLICVWIIVGFDSPVPALGQPVRGGVMRCIRGVFPIVLGYPPEFGPADTLFSMPCAERLVDWDEKGDFIGQLAESWEGDPKNNTFTWHLRRGVNFHDGTPFNAEALKWNYQMQIDAGRLPDRELVKSLEVLDEHTLRMYLTEYSIMAPFSYGFSPQFSPTAFKNNGGKEWARLHPVGTGPFKLADFKRDTSIRYERNENYWRQGYPLLDAMEIRFVPDPVTSAMMMEAKEADVWLEALTAKSAVELERKGFKVNWGIGMVWNLLPNSSNPKSPLNNKKVREAIECAVDRPTMAKMLGFGKYEPLAQIVPSASIAYVPGYDPRPYSPEKAKQLLAEAGYPNGFETKLLLLESDRDIGTAIQSYLAAVGIKLELDLADGGRFFASVFSPLGWTDLAFSGIGINPDSTDIFVHWGSRPQTYRFGQILKSPEYLALIDKALHTYDAAGKKKAFQQVVRQAGEDAMMIPLFRSAQANVMQPYAHSDYLKVHRQVWTSYRDWIEKRK
jgi:peptide/nickel transport system substrate-binding protein